MSRNKEIDVILLDVGSFSKPYLEDAKIAVTTLLTSKMLFKASHEVAIFLFGTNGCNNALHEEFQAQGDDTQYCNISELSAVSVPLLELIEEVNSIKSEQGRSDFMDALTVAIDLIYRTTNDRPDLERATVVKRIILLSNFLTEVEQDDGFAAELIQKMETANINLDAYCLAGDEASPNNNPVNANLAIVRKLMQGSQPHLARTSLEIRSLFPLKEYSSTAYFSGPLMFGDSLSVSVKVTKKVGQESIPSMGKYSDQGQQNDAKHTVSTDRIFRREGENEEEEVYAPEDMGKAYKYGGQIVPMAREQELALKYAPEKGFEVLGLVKKSLVPRHLRVGDTWFVAPEKGNQEAFIAMYAIATSLNKGDSALLARFVPRANGEVTLGLLTPLSGTEGCFTMNQLPFEADVRVANFTTFGKKPEVLPSKKQLASMDALLDAFGACAGDLEERDCEMTGSPTLQAFLQLVLGKALGAAIDDEAAKQLVTHIVDATKPPATEQHASLKRLSEDFVLQTKEKKKKKKKGEGDQDGEEEGDKIDDKAEES